jgi:hypothetical protein
MSGDIIIRVEGEDAAAVAETLAQIAEQQLSTPLRLKPDLPPSPRPGGPGDRVVDPISLAAMILAIPPAALAVWDIAKRIEARRKAAALLDAWRTPSLSARVKITVETPQGAVPLERMSVEMLLASAQGSGPVGR